MPSKSYPSLAIEIVEAFPSFKIKIFKVATRVNLLVTETRKFILMLCSPYPVLLSCLLVQL